MNRIILWMIILACVATPVLGQIDTDQTITKTGTSAAQFLKIGVDARATAMGGAFVAMEGDLSAMFWNPAGLGHFTGLGVMFVHSNWLADINFNHIALATDLGNVGIIGLSITNLAVPDDIVRTVEQPNGTGELFNSSDLAANLTFAKHTQIHTCM